MIELLIAFLLAFLPACPADEDSYSCVWENDGHTYINGPERDPAPWTVKVD